MTCPISRKQFGNRTGLRLIGTAPVFVIYSRVAGRYAVGSRRIRWSLVTTPRIDAFDRRKGGCSSSDHRPTLYGNGSRVWFGRSELRWSPIGYFLVAALPSTVAGSYLFADIDARWITRAVGVLLIAVVLYRWLASREIPVADRGMAFGGALTGFISGVAGSAGPLSAAFFLGLHLPATAYIASEALTAFAMHLTKTILYGRFAVVGSRELAYGVFLGVSMIVGSWTGKRLIERLSRTTFVYVVEGLLILSGLQLLLIG